MEGSVFAKSVELMVVGMGMTFMFLIILVFIMKVLEFAVEGFLNKWFPAKEAAVSAPGAGGVSDDKVKIAIALAAAKSMMK